MIKKNVLIIFIILILFNIVNTIAKEDISISLVSEIEDETGTYNLNDTIIIRITTNELTDIIGFGTCLEYNNESLSYITSIYNDELFGDSTPLKITDNKENSVCVASKLPKKELDENYTNNGTGILVNFYFKVNSTENINLNLGTTTTSIWENKNNTIFYFPNKAITISPSKIINWNNIILENKTIKISENIEFKNITEEENKTELVLEGNGIEEVMLEGFEEPYKLLVDNNETEFNYESGIITFTTEFSERIITLDYFVPIIEEEPEIEPEVESVVSSPTGSGGKRYITQPTPPKPTLNITNKTEDVEVSEPEPDSYLDDELEDIIVSPEPIIEEESNNDLAIQFTIIFIVIIVIAVGKIMFSKKYSEKIFGKKYDKNKNEEETEKEE